MLSFLYTQVSPFRMYSVPSPCAGVSLLSSLDMSVHVPEREREGEREGEGERDQSRKNVALTDCSQTVLF